MGDRARRRCAPVAMLMALSLLRGGAARAGACCTDGECTDVADASECAGWPFDPDESCFFQACEWGACCNPPLDCDEGVVGLNCDPPASHAANTPCSRVCYYSACCLPSGSCVDVHWYDCPLLDGDPHQWETCATATCAPALACCAGGDPCVEMTAEECEARGSSPVDAACSEVRCNSVEACCAERGCLDLEQVQCLEGGGAPQGPGTTCDASSCMGACCLPDGRCVDALPTDCSAAGGFSSPGSCAAVSCEVRACCLPDGSCTDLDLAGCGLAGGRRGGPGSACATWTCTRACCMADGSCRELDSGTCLVSGGAPGSSLSTCSEWTCSDSLPGRVPAGTPSAPGPPLRVAKSGADLVFTWSPSCSPAATDYSVQHGILGTWYSHVGSACTTRGSTAIVLRPSSGGRYYLVAPLTAGALGSFGTDSLGRERPGDPSGRCRSRQRTGCP